MSSPPSEPAEVPRKSSSWRPWRKTMLAGGLVLLAVALAEALMEPDPHQAFKVTGFAIGYVLLAVGFGMRMRDR